MAFFIFFSFFNSSTGLGWDCRFSGTKVSDGMDRGCGVKAFLPFSREDLKPLSSLTSTPEYTPVVTTRKELTRGNSS